MHINIHWIKNWKSIINSLKILNDFPDLEEKKFSYK